MQHCGIQITRITEETEEFLDMLVSWYFSGDWLEQDEMFYLEEDDKQLMATQENAITHTKQKIEKWSALVKSCAKEAAEHYMQYKN